MIMYVIVYNDGLIIRHFKNLDTAIEFIKTRKNCRIEEVWYE